MSYANFKPVVWSKYIQHELPKFTVFKQDCDFKFEGDAGQGKRVKILNVGRPTIKKYIPNKDIDPAEKIPDASTYLDIDQFDYFNYGIDDIDKAQSMDGVMEALQEETTRGMAEQEDIFCATQMAKNAGYKTESTEISTAEEAKAAIDKLFVKLWNQGVSTKDKVTMYLTPWFYSLFQNKLIELKTNNDELIAQGVLGLYNNAKVKMTNNAYNDGTDDYIIVKTSKAFAYCNGIDKLKPYEPEKGFAEAVKGLNAYGGKMVRPKECAVLRCHQK